MAGLPAGKKRYYLSLHEENMTWLKNWFEQNLVPNNMTSVLVDEFIGSLRKTILELEKRCAAGEKISVSDLFAMTGKNLESVEEAFFKEQKK